MPYVALDPTLAAAAPAITYGLPEAASKHPRGKSLLSMRTRLRVELGNRSAVDLPDATVDEWINDSYLDMTGGMEFAENKKSFSFTTVVGQPFYLLPTTVDGVRTVSGYDPSTDTVGTALEKSDAFKYRKRPTQDGDPLEWFREQQMLVLWPTPDRVLTLTVDAKILYAKLALDTDYPAIEDKWHEALFQGAKARGWEALQNDTKAELSNNRQARLISRKDDMDGRDQDDMYPSMRPVFSRRDLMNLSRRNPRVEPGDC